MVKKNQKITTFPIPSKSTNQFSSREVKNKSVSAKDGIKKYSQTFDVIKPSKQDKEEIAKTLYDHYQTAIMEFDDKYKEIYNKLNEDNQERIDFMLNDDKEYDKVLEFVSQFQ